MRYIIFLLIATFALIGCDKDDDRTFNDIVETIQVSGDGYLMSRFKLGAKLLTDSDIAISDMPKYFNDFEILITAKGVHNGGFIMPKFDGLIFVLAPEKSLPEWISMSTDMVVGGADVPLILYMKRAYGGVPIAIPKISGDFPVYPLARKIDYLGKPMIVEE